MRRIKLFLIATIILVGSILFFNNFISNSQYEIASNKIPKAFDRYKIVQISDLHSRDFGCKNEKLIRKIEEQEPNIVVMTGDMVSTEDANFDVFLTFEKSIAAEFDTYFIVGNHEQNLKVEQLQTLLNKLEQMNVNVIDNEKIAIKKDGESINLYGMWFNLRYYNDASNEYTKDITFNIEQMEKILGIPNQADFNIVLTHNPIYFKTYAE
ncbi:metallophosphoesterase [Viridibacillus sp. YIM B01967]|uniref:Metallophosphoesterase n=1 Tax=Viridibacillus soli TaxID=2798301 RepID=A0ABS1HCS7_9BACL|nr:metallophosphoesterase [Viridibacillus soli]MBK3497207.1 metallophosphoesterase [Viridibacillus soli]